MVLKTSANNIIKNDNANIQNKELLIRNFRFQSVFYFILPNFILSNILFIVISILVSPELYFFILFYFT